MPRQRTLVKASRLLRAKRFAEVISLLEPQVFLYRENFSFYYVLGVACLYAGDFGGAYSYLQRAQQLNHGHPGVLQGLAAVHLRRREAPEALRYWLKVLDEDPRNHPARRGLELVRRTTDPGDFVAMAESGRLRRFYPSLGFRFPLWTVPVAVVIIVAAVTILSWPTIRARLSPGDVPVRSGSEFAELDEAGDELTDFAGEYRYVMNDDEIERTFQRAGAYFNDFRDNLAQREVNRLLQSNASALVKERARLLSAYFEPPTFVTFRDNFTYRDVSAEPWLYDGCYVKWSGQTSNVRITDDEITFTLLVGYEDQRVLEGTVAVRLTFAADVRSGPVELIGRVDHDTGGLSVEATSIRRLAPASGS